MLRLVASWRVVTSKKSCISCLDRGETYLCMGCTLSGDGGSDQVIKECYPPPSWEIIGSMNSDVPSKNPCTQFRGAVKQSLGTQCTDIPVSETTVYLRARKIMNSRDGNMRGGETRLFL